MIELRKLKGPLFHDVKLILTKSEASHIDNLKGRPLPLFVHFRMHALKMVKSDFSTYFHTYGDLGRISQDNSYFSHNPCLC